MRASSASGRGASGFPRRTNNVIRLPLPRAVRRQRTLRLGTALIALACATAVAARIYIFQGPAATNLPPVAPPNPEEGRILALVNGQRVSAGVATLELSERLLIAARMHSADMAARGYLAHDGPGGDTPVDRVRAAGLGYHEIAENLYADAADDRAALPARAIRGWLADRAHRDNLLAARFHATAIAVARGADGTWYVTQDFIR
ncbi:MAG TPA: CAP domain-containing protein [Candidatus Binataceae bacterium]|nr:CAP domain-containing protein [Candidatus Binataceae bacterium]